MKTESEANFMPEKEPIIDKKVTPEKEPKPAAKKKSTFNRVLQKVGYALLFFFLGALLVGVVLYLPARSSLNTAQAELDRLLPMEAEFVETSVKADIYQILSNVSNMQIALIKEDGNRASQYVSYIADDLAALTVIEKSDVIQSLSSQFEGISAEVKTDPAAALDSLQDLQNDLLLLIDSLN